MTNVPEGPGTALAHFLIEYLPEIPMTNDEIAKKLGYARPNIMSMWKTASSKVPLDNVMMLAEIFKVDPSYMLALYVDQYVSSHDGVNRFDEIVSIFDRLVTPDEWEIVETIREARKFNTFRLRDHQRAELKKLFAEEGVLEGPYKPLKSVEHVGEGRGRDKFKFRGFSRDMSVTEQEDAASSADTPKKGTVRKRSVAAKSKDHESV